MYIICFALQLIKVFVLVSLVTDQNQGQELIKSLMKKDFFSCNDQIKFKKKKIEMYLFLK